MAGTLELKRRIKSVTSTKKITRAMQMVSAAKMRKAQSAALASRTYSRLAWEIITNLADQVDPEYHRLLQTNTTSKAEKKIGLILVSSNRGLIGGFNTNLLALTNKFLESEEKNTELIAEVTVVGKKGRDALLRMGKNIVAEFPKHDRTVPLEDIIPLSQMVVVDHLAGKYSKIVIAYTDFISTITQKPKIVQLLPLPTSEHHEHLPDTPPSTTGKKKYHYEYLFEPRPQEVLDYLLPRIIQAQIYQAILESDASEHSARMVMMKNATDAANDLIDDLTLTYNQIRQANITKELAEITAGRIAVE